MRKTGTLSGIDTTKFNEDTVIEGLRIPANLDTITNVNFVLTQEKGKLKPKDLKAAIEKNRAEKRRRAEEQEKLRMAGGGVGPGMLDLRAILADDSLNVSDADPFKRQLREMAFLADVEDVRKLETEKEFRISEVYLGSYHLSEEDISQILKQREDQELFKKKSEWRRVLDRNRTELHPPVGNGKKAGASIAVSNEVIQQLTPHFDANRNDVWSKRMNTLRRFVSLTSKWIMRERVRRRFQTVLDTFHRANAYTRTEVLQFIQEENANYRSKNGASSSGSAAGALEGGGAAGRASLLQDTGADPPQGWTLAQVVCAMPNEWLETRLAQEAIISQSNTYELAAEMVKRFLFPRFEADESTQRLPMTMKPVAEDAQFDDKTYFQLKLRPEWQALRYGKHTAPTCPMVFAAQPYLPMRTGAPEECALRYPADKHVPLDTVLEAVYPSAEGGVAASAVQLLDMWTVMEASSSADTARTEGELTHAPSTLFTDPAWHNYEMDFFRTKHEHRSYHSLPVRSEMDPDYALRPFAKTLLYDPDTSLRSRWLQEPGFASTNFYALGAAETRDWSLSAEVLPRPAPGPSLVDFYFPDLDRHTSGLHCYELDHQRSLQEHDLDVAPLQSKMATEDHLTDSESDDDEAYVTQKPTLTIVRRILHGLERMAVPEPTPLVASSSAPPAKGVAPTKAAGNKGAPEPAPAPTSPEPKPSADDESIAEPDGDNLQVELLRDRKILEMESYLKKLRQQSSLTISERLETMAAATPCLLQRAVVQRPIHIYEESLVRALQEVKPPAQQGGYTEAIGTMLLSPTKSVRASDDFSVTSAFTNNK